MHLTEDLDSFSEVMDLVRVGRMSLRNASRVSIFNCLFLVFLFSVIDLKLMNIKRKDTSLHFG